jgi:hypothetical protein
MKGMPANPQTLKTENLYHNCNILGPDGRLLCRSGRKKIGWYLKMGLAAMVSEEPLTIQLNFEPAGEGARSDPFGMSDKINCCVVCGESENLTKHHIVPYTFRRHFPANLKEHQSHDVLMLCLACHVKYEPEAQKLHMSMCDEYGIRAQEPREKDPEYQVRGLCFALVKHGAQMPPERREEILRKIAEIKGTEYDYIARASDPLKDQVDDRRTRNCAAYGRAVATSDMVDLQEFSARWRWHFVDVMEPKFLPDHWDPNRKLSENT